MYTGIVVQIFPGVNFSIETSSILILLYLIQIHYHNLTQNRPKCSLKKFEQENF